MSIKLVVWDWNGTVIDDVSITVRAVNTAVLPLLNLPQMTVQQYQDVFEVPIIKNYLNLGVSEAEFLEKSESISRAFHSTYEPLAARARTRKGARRVLENLLARDVDSVILSNHTVDGIYLQLSRLKLESYFEAVLANDDIEQVHHFGKQHRLETYISQNNVKPHEILIIGDTAEETAIGHALGLNTVAITGGFSSRIRLVAAKPDYVISSVKQVVTIVEELA